MEAENNVKDIAKLARDGDGAKLVSLGGGVQVLSIPGDIGVEVQSIKAFVDEWRTAPERRKGTAKMLTLESLTAFVNRQKDGGSALFATLDGPAAGLTAVFDYHQIDGAPRFGGHRALYAFPQSPEWQAWKGRDGKAMEQDAWAAFIEERIAELSAPLDQERTDYESLFQTKIAVPSDLITLSRGMQISVESKVRDFRVLQSGETEISFEEVHKDGSGAKLIVPGLFVIRIPLFVDGVPIRILARLRYRRVEGKILWFYQLYRADLVMREAMRNDAETVARDTALPLFEGSPEA